MYKQSRYSSAAVLRFTLCAVRLALALTFLAPVVPAHADTWNWNGSLPLSDWYEGWWSNPNTNPPSAGLGVFPGSGWNLDATNWTDQTNGGRPGFPGDAGSGDIAYIGSGYTVTAGENVTTPALNIAAGSQYIITNTTTATNGIDNDGTIYVGYGAAGVLNFSGAQTLSGTGTVILNLAGSNAQLNGTVTQAAGHTIAGCGQINAALTNHGLVNANQSGGTLDLRNSAITNDSTMEATGGGILNLSNSVNNTGGTILANGGTLNLTGPAQNNAGTMEATGGGTLFIGTNVNNTGGTILNSGGTVQFSGGVTITGGTISASGGSTIQINTYVIISGSTLASSGTSYIESNANPDLSGVTVAPGTTFNIPYGASADPWNGLTNNGTIVVGTGSGTGTAQLTFRNASQTLSGTGSIVLQGTNAAVNGGGTFTQAAGHTIQGCGSVSTSSITNQGLINANQNGGTLVLSSRTALTTLPRWRPPMAGRLPSPQSSATPAA